jgi:hypothetical protein
MLPDASENAVGKANTAQCGYKPMSVVSISKRKDNHEAKLRGGGYIFLCDGKAI